MLLVKWRPSRQIRNFEKSAARVCSMQKEERDAPAHVNPRMNAVEAAAFCPIGLQVSLGLSALKLKPLA